MSDSPENNLYRPPEADLAVEPELPDDLMSEPQKLPISAGYTWISEGLTLFKQSPATWIGMFLLMMVTSVIVSVIGNFIPVVGSFISMAFTAILTGGIALTAHACYRGESVNAGGVFSGFEKAGLPLASVGALYMLGFFLVIIVVFAIGAVMIDIEVLAGLFAGEEPDFSAMGDYLQSFAILMLLMMMFVVPVIMAYYFSPTLIALHNITAWQAMKLSFKGCLRNMFPFLLYGILATVIMLIAMIPFGLGLLFAMPILMLSMYSAYRGVFLNPHV